MFSLLLLVWEISGDRDRLLLAVDVYVENDTIPSSNWHKVAFDFICQCHGTADGHLFTTNFFKDSNIHNITTSMTTMDYRN